MPKNGNPGTELDLSSHALRSRLPPRAEPYWVPTRYKRLSVGYQCTPEEGSRWARAGVARWVGRLWSTERRAYSHKVLGIPDDADATTGVINPVLRPISFAEALEAAATWARGEGDPLDLRPDVSPKPNGSANTRSGAKPD